MGTALSVVIGILIGLIAARLLAGRVPSALSVEKLKGQTVARFSAAWNRLKAALPPAAEPRPAPAQTDMPAMPSLSERLHKLESTFAPTAANSAHPRELSDQKEFLEAARLLQDTEVPLETVMQYALGANWALSCAAFAALAERADSADVLDEVLAAFDRLSPWAMHFALRYLLFVDPRPPVGAPLVRAREWWADNVIIPVLFREYLVQRERLGDVPEFGSWLDASGGEPSAELKSFLVRLSHPLASALLQNLHELRRANVDRTFLSSFGRFWKTGTGLDTLVEPAPWLDALTQAETPSPEHAIRSLLVSGDHRVGKTSFLKVLATRLESDGWQVFEAGGADLMAGQQWFGQLEGRIQRTVEELAATRKLIWYIPDILQVALSGTHQGQAASILDQILPAVSAGRLIVWTEASPAATSRLLRLRPALRGIFELARLEPMTSEETATLAEALICRISVSGGPVIKGECVPAALASARQYLGASSLPGSVLDLLRLTAQRAGRSPEAGVDAQGVMLTLSQLTGLPVSILDNNERVDLAAVRAYFAERVIGQDEAVAAVVERIAMLKAGLNDPGKPIGVFLFAGPTGTGKTELAKTLAEFLFGSIDRLIRLDMSELQTAESTIKILGSGDAPGAADSLINRVRKQPFSVVLLDEFEKAHANVWDLFLQVFDDGRLTDSLGHVADFRHCIVILTTNLGATTHRGSDLGFSPAASAFSSDQITRAIGQTFRPEFQNRLDKVIVFHPLSRDLMRGILKKELGQILERRGLKDREWAVEWEASALDFLLEKGFSPEMGARPLKRAIDQYVIAPLAATIVEKRFPEGDQFVFVRSDGRGIQAEFVDPDRDPTAASLPPAATAQAAADHPRALPAIILAPAGTAAELQALEAEHAAIRTTFASTQWEELKANLADRMLPAEFWRRPDRYETLARIALMDRVKSAAATAEALQGRLARGAERAGKSSRELAGRLALQLHLVKEGIKDVFEAAPIEVALRIEPAFERPGDGEGVRRWCAQLLDMYRGWAANRHMQLDELAGERSRDLPLLVLSGFGAHRMLTREVGLHVLELPDDERGGADRLSARVRLVPAPLGDLAPPRLRAELSAAFERTAASSAVVRRYRNDPSPLVRDIGGSWRTGRLDAVLRGDFDLIGAGEAAE